MRRRAARGGAQFSLFPFLAVLLCTMGSLIVLLLVLVQQARVEADEQVAAASEPPDAAIDFDQLRERREEDQAHLEKLNTMASQLDELRSTLTAKVTTSRLQLTHLEDHIRRLRDKLETIQADYQVLTQTHQEDAGGRQRQRMELQKLNEQIAGAQLELEEAKQIAHSKPRSFSIVPYDGPRGTRRRPIYLECHADRLIIQPEGHVLLLGDMESAGAGNPLAAALRATREHLLTTGSLQGGEPYPLLLVRPDGAKTYSAARGAMSSWGSEYGYELIDADMPLEFPPADERLADVVRRSIDLARRQQEAIAAVNARQQGRQQRSGGGVGGPLSTGTGRSPGGTYLAPSRNGGFEVRGGSDGGDWLDSHVAAPGQTGMVGRNEASPNTAAQSPHESNNQAYLGSGQGGSQFAAGGTSSRPPQSAGGGFYPTEQPGATATAANGSPTAQHNTNNTANASSAISANAPPANGNPSPSGSAATQDGDVMAPLFSTGQSGPSNDQANATGGDVSPVAQSRGTGWALPASARGATPYSRPIRVEVHADRLIVLPDRGDNSKAHVVPLNGPMQRSIDGFVGQIWEHMNGWGIAGPQAYWKPILSVDVVPGGEARFAELSGLMQQSGVEVERKR